jgi:NADH:ubiquinone oxidoreductase subunit 3 (subunit A)
MFNSFFFIKYFFFFCLIISILLFNISFLLNYQLPNIEKLSAYECGFNPFGDARYKFEIHYYTIGILYIIFDLEIIYLFPWIMCFYELNLFGYLVMLFFLFILTLGFIFELFIGVLNWN